MAVLWSCPRVVRCVTVFACFSYLLTCACRDVVADLEPDLAEVIYSHAPEAGWSAKELGVAYCAATCTGGAKDEL